MLSYFDIFAPDPPPSDGVGGGAGANKKYRISRQFMKCLTFESFTHKTPNSRWGGVELFFCYYFSLQFMTFPGLLICWPPKIPTATPLGGGVGKNLFRFSRQFMKFPGLLKCWPPTPPPPRNPTRNPPGWGGSNTFVLLFWTVHDISWTFDLLTP